MKVSKTGYKRTSQDKNKFGLIVPSNEITMEDVDFPVFGISDTGDAKMMYPGLNYSFKGNYVYEFPIKKEGGHILPGRFKNPEGSWLSKYQTGGDISIPDLNKAKIGLTVPSNKDAFSKSTAQFYEKWKEPVRLGTGDERILPSVEKEEDLPVSYRRNMGDSTTKGIQTKLKKYDPSLKVDGIWGPLTEKAYRKYWNQHLQEKEIAQTFENEKAQQTAIDYYRPTSLPQDYFRNYNITEGDFETRTKTPIDVERKTLELSATEAAKRLNVDIPGKVTYDFYNKENPITGKPLKNYTDSELLAFVENQGLFNNNATISTPQDKSTLDYVKHYYDILSDPFNAGRLSRTEEYKTPFGFSVYVPDVPWGFDKSPSKDDTVLHSTLQMANPLTYVNAAGRLGNSLKDSQTYYDLASLTGFAGKSFLGAVTGEDLPITDEQRTSSMRGLNTVTDALTVAPIAAEAAPFAKGFIHGSVPAMLQRATNALVTPTKTLTLIEKESLQMIQRANRFLAQNSTTASGNLTKKAVQNIMNDPAKLASLNSITEKLHPSVVKNMLGTDNYSLIKDVIKTNANGLGLGQLSKIEQGIIGARITQKALFTPKALTPKNLENPSYMAGYNIIKPKAFVQNNELDKKATGLIASMFAKDANVTSSLRAARNKIDSASEGELFVGSRNMSVDSYPIANKELLTAMQAGKVVVDDIVMAPLNNAGVVTSATLKSPVFYKAGLKSVNEEIAKLEQALGKSLPKAYFDATEQRIIAPYIVAKKIVPPSLKRVKTRIQIKEINPTTGRLKTRYEDSWKYIGTDGSGLRPSETIIKEAKDYVPKFGTTTSKPKYKIGGQSGRISSYEDFLNAYNL